MRPALAIRVNREWVERSERETGVARRAIAVEFGEEWAADDADIGKVKVLDGVRGRGAAAWIPVVEWTGLQVASGLMGQAALAGIERVWAKIRDARSSEHRVMVSRGLAATLAMRHVFETTNEKDLLQVEFIYEPSMLAGRPLTETSYTGIEPWIVSLVDGSQKSRYLVAVNPEGDIEGCIATPVGTFEAMYSPLSEPE
jgi:hypothetical protein